MISISALAGPHPRSLSLGDFAPRSGRRRSQCRITFFAATLAATILSAGIIAGPEQQRSAVPANPDDRTIVHVLNRLGFGAAPGDIERVRRMGLREYIDRQLHPERVPDEALTARLAPFTTITKSTRQLAEEYFVPALMLRRDQKRLRAEPQPGAASQDPRTAGREMRSPEQVEAQRAERTVLAELAQHKLVRAAYSERQLEEVMVDFWFNHFNVFAGKGLTRVYLTGYERDAIRPHALGRFRDVLGATAHSPAMLFYLDNWQSAAPGGAGEAGPMRPMRGRMPSRAPRVQPNRRPGGLNENYARELMELHTLGVEGGYTQKDVHEVARAFTGWSIDTPRQGGAFRFAPRMHDDGGKIVLGHRIAAGGGEADGERVLDILAAHPSTARFIATKLARKLVADVPPAPLVARAAARFRETRGDIREVVKTIVTSPEFFSDEAYRAKVKTPLEFVVSALRATGAEMPTALPVVQALRDLGMPLYGCQPPTGYADRADAWVNTGALLGRMNFAVSLTSGKLRGAKSNAASGAADPVTAREMLIASALAGDIAESTRSTVAKATTGPQAAALVLGSPEFQKR